MSVRNLDAKRTSTKTSRKLRNTAELFFNLLNKQVIHLIQIEKEKGTWFTIECFGNFTLLS